MNKDKAIQLLERLQDPEPYEPMLTKDAYDAIQMAIDALSADGDTISRQAAISAICNACGKIDCDKMDKCEKLQLPPANCSEFPNNSDTISRKWLMECVDEGWIKFDTEKDKNIYVHLVRDIAPSAQPERTPMQELLDTTADRDYWKAQCHSYEMTINRLTESAQPGIIRCKDCKYRDENWRRVSVRWLPCMDVRTGSNWYCGSAERKDDERFNQPTGGD